MEDTIVAIRKLLRDMDMNDEFMLRALGGVWEAHACNMNNAVPLGEVDGMFYHDGDTMGEAVQNLWDSVAAWHMEYKKT